jgi:catechol 2,3-dioxygenase-like lactoylglutathione lyase family enzyme
MAKKAKKATKKTAARRVTTKRKAARPATSAPAAKGLVSVTPGFTVNDAEKSVAWYRDVLGFKVKERWEQDGQFHGAQIASGAVTVNLGQDDWKLGRDRVKGQGTRLYILTGPNIDQFATQIKARGGTLDQEPTDGWGVRAFSLKDPDGFNLTFMTPLRLKKK